MQIIENEVWRYYLDEDQSDLRHSPFVGKWMIFPTKIEHAQNLCKAAVENKLVSQAKHSLTPKKGSFLCCFYLNIYDYDKHERFLSFFRDNGLLPRNYNGNYTNIAFKLDVETAMGIYGADFKGSLHLADFIDVETGEWSRLYQRKKVENDRLYLINKLAHNYMMPGFPEYSNLRNTWIKHGDRQRLNKEDYFNREYVSKQLEEKRITTEAVAARIDVKENTVKNWLSGKSRPYVWYVYALIVYYNLEEKQVLIKAKS